MSILPLLIAFASPGGQLAPPKVHDMVGVRSLALSPNGDQIAFSYRGDIWVGSSKGGKATAVTNNVEMDDNPIWSPDGKWIAYATDRHGNWDIYAVPVDGGESVRLTWNSGTEIPSSWTPDGKELVYRASYDKGFTGIYRLDVKTLRMREVFVSQFPIDMPTVSADGQSIYYLYKSSFPYFRPRYEGSGAAQIWKMGMDGSERKKVVATGQQHLWPKAGEGDTVYAVTVSETTPSSRKLGEKPGVFVDNVNRTPNVYSVKNGRSSRVTNFIGGSGTRYLTTSANGKFAYEVDGQVFIGDEKSQLPVNFNGVMDSKVGTSERLILTNAAENATLSPDGKSVVFQVRRELWSVPVTKGKGPNGADATQLTDYAGSDEEPIYSTDGKFVFFTSDREDAKALYKMEIESKKVTLVHQTGTEIGSLTVTPDKKSVAFWVSGLQGGLFMTPMAGGAVTKVIDKPWRSHYAFSPDMKYVAYERPLVGSGFKYWEEGTNIWVREVSSGKEENVTRLNLPETGAAWSADGKYLYFISARDGGGLYAIPTQKEEASRNELELKFTKPTGEVKVDFDFSDVASRIRRLVPGPVNGGILSDPENGDVFFNRGGDIWKAGYDGDGARPIMSGGGISGSFDLANDKTRLFFIKSGQPGLVDIRKPNYPVSMVEFRADWHHDLVAERKAAFHEFWRAYNDSFYDDYMHRRDWRKIRDRYEPLLDSIANRREMSIVLNQMVGELESSHSEVSVAGGGERSETTAHLGFTIDYSYGGPGIKIKDVPKGTPGSFEKTKINAGEYVMAINGQDVTTDQNLWKLLNEQTGRDVTLLVNTRSTKADAREVKYRAMSSGAFRGVLYDNLIQWRREYVEAKSGGKLTYVHIAGMGGGNLETFNREMWEYVNGKQGVIIDVRENGGGNIADILVDALERKTHMRYQPRSGEAQDGPGQAWGNKPAVVMHAETSFSNAEMFPAAMKTLGLAELVGMPTPGYVIYTYGGVLVDGTPIRLPSTGVYRVDGTPTENMGQKPDYMVDIDPDQYFNGKDPQLDKAIEVLLKKTGK